MGKKMKIAFCFAIPFMIAGLMFGASALINGGQTVSSVQASSQDEATMIIPPPDLPSKVDIPYMEGNDPRTGRPFVKQAEDPIAYGTPPPQESWKKMTSDYPYIATLPAGLEGKIRVEYNFVIPNSQRYQINVRVKNLSDRTLEKFYFNQALLNADGVELEGTDNVDYNSPNYGFPIRPGGLSDAIRPEYTSVEPGFGGEEKFKTWKVKVDVTYASFQ